MQKKRLRIHALRAALALTLSTASALADPCLNPTLSPCFDANELWLAPGRTHFLSLPDTELVSDLATLTLAQELIHSPVLARVNSPDPAGRELRLVNFAFDTSLLASANVVSGLAVALALPVRSYQTGAGIGALTAQSAPPIAAPVLRDPRFTLAYSFNRLLALQGFGLLTSLETSLPLGDDAAFAGERWLVVMPKLMLSAQLERVHGELGLGARLREQSVFGGLRIGNQGFLAAGFGVDALPHDLLFVGAEAWALPALSKSSARGGDDVWTAAEWSLSARSRFSPGSAWSLQLAGGGGIPLSSANNQHFAGVTTPEYRLLVSGRYELSLSTD